MKKTRNGMRITGLLLTMVMLVALLGAFSLTASAAAAEDISVTIDTGASITLKDTDGDGAYEIGNADELYAFAAAVNGGNTAINGELTANIVVNQNVLKDDGTLNGDGSNFRVWTPIGIGLGFMGIFDGNGHTISGLYLNDDTRDGIGLFREINFGTVRGVGVIDSYIRGRELVGGIAGSNWGNVEYCYNVGTVVGTRIVAGVVGGGTGTVENCYNTGNVSGISEVGGVIGFVNGSTKVINCYNTGDVSGTDYIGGIGGASYGEVENCYNTGNVSGTEYVGGVTGYYGGDGDVTSCYYLAGTADGGIDSEDISGQAEAKDADWFTEYPICRVVGFSHEWADGSCTACGYVCIHDGEVTPATCQKQAVCETCGESYGELAEDNHNFDEFNTCVCGVKNFHIYGQQLNVGGDLSMKYYVTAFGDGVSTETLTMEFLFLGKKTEVSGVYDSETRMYVFTLDGINPQCMGDEIDAYLLLDGEEKANKLDYTVEENLLALREKYKDDTALVALVNDILAYGSAASEYKGYGSMTDDYVSSDREIPTTNVAPSDAFTGYTVTFGQMNYIKIRVNLADGNTLYLGETDITNELVDGIYKTAGIAPTDFDNVFNFTVKNGDETVATFALSVNDYISAMQNDASIGNLVKALYNYGVSAEVYEHRFTGEGEHVYVETAPNDNQTHKVICVCGHEVTEAHELVDGKCECGVYEITIGNVTAKNFDGTDRVWKSGDTIKVDVWDKDNGGYERTELTYDGTSWGSIITDTKNPVAFAVIGNGDAFANKNSYDIFVYDQQEQSQNVDDYDLMYAYKASINTDAQLDLHFEHLFTKITLNIEYGSEFTETPKIEYVLFVSEPLKPFVTITGINDGNLNFEYAEDWVHPSKFINYGDEADMTDDTVEVIVGIGTLPAGYDFIHFYDRFGTTEPWKKVLVPEGGLTFKDGEEYEFKILITADGAYIVCNDGCDYEHTVNDDGTHTVTCKNGCGYEVTKEHTFDEKGVCVCGKYEVTVDLSTLNATYVINDNRYYEFIGTGSYGIKVESGNPTIILNNANITVSSGSAIDIPSGSTTTIQVIGDNTIGTTKTEYWDAPCGGIFVAEGGIVNITSNGTDNILRAHGTLAAAIGGKYVNYEESHNAGNINISNVTVYAYTNNYYAAAIGAAGEGTCGTINITNAVVYAYGAGDQYTSAPGIGSAWDSLDWLDAIPIVIISNSEVHTFRYNPYSDYIGYLGDESGDTYATGSINCGDGGSVKNSTIYCYTGLDATTTDKVVIYDADGNPTENQN